MMTAVMEVRNDDQAGIRVRQINQIEEVGIWKRS